MTDFTPHNSFYAKLHSKLTFLLQIFTVFSHSVFNNHHVAEWKRANTMKYVYCQCSVLSVAESHSLNFILEILLSVTHDFVAHDYVQMCTDKYIANNIDLINYLIGIFFVIVNIQNKSLANK